MRTKDTKLMSDIINFIESEYQNKCVIPTIREIADALNVSKSKVGSYVLELKNKGLVQSSNKSRSIRTKSMTKLQNDIQYVPVIGCIACGSPLLAEQNIETYLPLPNGFLGNGKHFILKASGNSMINAGIDDGDYVIVKQQEIAEQGQIVVALINDEATLKRYYLDNKKQRVRLHPENDEMEDMFFDNISIQGVAVKVIKDL